MIDAARPVQRVILYEGRDARPLAAAVRLRLLTALLDRGYWVSRVRAGNGLTDFGHRQLVVLGQFDGRPPHFDNDNDVQIHVHDIHDGDVDRVVAAVDESCTQIEGGTASGWKPWFPVIDFDRCTNCMQCLSFCLFDVYGVTSEGKITVQNENHCKTDCPACSRVCPEVAILFPKYKAGPINGDEVSDDDVRREAMKVDISALLGGDIYSMLRDRSEKAKSRFSKERDDERALRERQRCLKKLQEQLDDWDVPPDVLGQLPTADQIQEKAMSAKKRAQAALGTPQQDQPSPSR
jgi:NAD-dependent dihydropyrimidine dehydrogenase PreA subunit